MRMNSENLTVLNDALQLCIVTGDVGNLIIKIKIKNPLVVVTNRL